jgi:hypothetical protein
MENWKDGKLEEWKNGMLGLKPKFRFVGNGMMEMGKYKK